MNSNFIINDDTLARYFADELSAEEQLLIEQWVEKSPENKKRFEAFSKIWEEGDAIAPTINVNVNEAWKTVLQNINSVEQQRKKSFVFPIWAKIAAVMIPLLISGWLIFYFNTSSSNILAFIVKEKKDSLILSDGSKVIAMENSELHYPQLFDGKTREVKLKGNAFFSIAHNTAKPFIVHAGGLDITVVGTEFLVIQQKEKVTVKVKSGKVKVRSVSQTVILTEGEQANYNEIANKLTELPKANPTSQELFKFDQSSLLDVVTAIETIYGVKVHLGTNLKNCPITIRINRKDSLETILQVLEATLNIKTSRKSNAIYISGEGC